MISFKSKGREVSLVCKERRDERRVRGGGRGGVEEREERQRGGES